MATTQYSFTGPVRWAKVWPGQCDRRFAESTPGGGNWSVVMTLTGPDEKKYNALGFRNQALTEDDIAIAALKAKKKGKESNAQIGDVTFRRYERHAKLGDLGSPAVLGVEEGALIGNGSVCTAVVDVYTYPTPDGSTGVAGRLVSLTVNELVVYVKPLSNDEPPVF